MAYASAVRFEWDAAKNAANRKKHGASFEEAQDLFTSGVEYLELFDEAHSAEEDRFIAIGPVRRGVILVAYTERLEDTIRIISVRHATAAERKLFQTHMEHDEP